MVRSVIENVFYEEVEEFEEEAEEAIHMQLLFPFSDCVIEWNVGGANFIVDLFSLSFGETVGVELEG